MLADFRRAGAELDAAGKEAPRDRRGAHHDLPQVLAERARRHQLLPDPDREDRAPHRPPERALLARLYAENKKKSGYRFTLQAPSYVAVMTYADDAALREQMYRAFNARATAGDHDNRPDPRARMLELRREKAKLLG